MKYFLLIFCLILCSCPFEEEELKPMPSDEQYKPDPSILDYCPAEDVAEYPIADKLPDNWDHTAPAGVCLSKIKLSKEKLLFGAKGGVRCITTDMRGEALGVNDGGTLDDSQKYACEVEDKIGWNEYKSLKCSWLVATKVSNNRVVRISVDKNETGKERKYNSIGIGGLYCWSDVLITQSAE